MLTAAYKIPALLSKQTLPGRKILLIAHENLRLKNFSIFQPMKFMGKGARDDFRKALNSIQGIPIQQPKVPQSC